MTSRAIEIDHTKLAALLHLAPQRLAAEMDRRISLALMKMARTAKRLAPKAHSTLANSLQHQMLSSYEGELVAGVNYGLYREGGTGKQGLPPEQSILDWIKVRNIQPHDPDMSQEDLAFLVARSIAAKGTPAQPYAGPAMEQHIDDTLRSVTEGIDLVLGMG